MVSFNLEGIAPTSDVVIKVSQDRHEIKVIFSTLPSEAMLQSFNALKKDGLSVNISVKDWRNGVNIPIYVVSHTYDILQIAERLSISLESEGLSVTRINKVGETIQSFALA